MCVPYLQNCWLEMKMGLLGFRASGDRIGYIRILLRRTGRYFHRTESVEEKVSFDDVGGCEDAKRHLKLVAGSLQYIQKGVIPGSRVLREGVILNGRPGTGKTLLAKAVASEADVPLITVCGPDFEETFVGRGPAVIRGMFARARRKAPCILFIDEIDVIGRKRSSDGFGVRSEEELILTQLLRELDGLRSDNVNVFIMAATNRIDILDEALLRPGRFDKEIFVPAPDIGGREAIFRLHLQRLQTDVDDVQLPRRLASFSLGLTGDDIANVCHEAALIAAKDMSDKINGKHFQQPIAARKLPPKELLIIAYHEAGRIVAGWYLEHADLPLKFSIVPGGKGLREAQYLPRVLFQYNIEQLLDGMCMTLGGGLSEEIFTCRTSAKAQDDLEEITQMAHSMAVKYGTSDSECIDQEVQELVNKLLKRTRQLLNEHKEDVEKIVDRLLQKEILTRTDISVLLGQRCIVIPSRWWDIDVWLPKELERWNKVKDIEQQKQGQ